MDTLNFAGDFPEVSLENWQSAALKALRGAALSDLDSVLYEQLAVAPLYARSAGANAARLSGSLGASPFIRGARLPAGQGWAIIQFLDHPDVAEASRQLREELANGTRAFWIQFLGNIPYGGSALGARKVDALDAVFADVALEDVEIHVSGGSDTIAAAALIAALIERRGVAPVRVKGSAGLDPLSNVAATGAIPAERPRLMAEAVDAATYLREKNYGLTPFLVSGRAWHQAGGSSREELGFALAAGVAYFRALIDAGWSLEDAAKAIRFSLTADADIFLTIAKFRAMRALWARVTEASGLAATPPSVIAEMSFRMVTERDPHVNLLRATAAAFGAAVGGAEALLLIPFNTRHGTPDAFSRRLARNTQLILGEEAQLGRVADEAGGSWYVESLTHELAAAAWDEFRAVEAAGGLLAALEQGLIARKLTDVRMRRYANLARNRDKITGVSSYPDICEEPVFSKPEDIAADLTGIEEEIEIALPPASKGKRFAALVEAALNGASLKSLERACESLAERVDFIPSTAERAAEPFEELRAASDRAMSRVRARPPVFLANLGALADYNARAGWAKNFFAAGGIEALDEGGFTDLQKLLRKFQRSPAPVACICASPKALAAMMGVASALKRAGAVAVYLAADPDMLGGLNEADKRAIDRIVYDGCDMLKTLTELHHMMRVKELGQGETEDFDDDEDLGRAGLRS